MNLYHVQNHASWIAAPKDARSEFIEAMRQCQYGAQETLEAWRWFLLGWLRAHNSGAV